MPLKDHFIIFFILFVSFVVFITATRLVQFLSAHKPLQSLVFFGHFESVELQISIDLFLVALFALQHSLQCSKRVKDILFRRGYDHFQRLLYNLGSCFSLQVLMLFWNPISSWVVWEISCNDSLWWLFTIIHGIAWLQIYFGWYIMDMPEMLGIKQVIYALQDNPAPLSLKSEGLCRFYSHMRHPGFCAFCVILFVHPIMQLDRLLLAHGVMAYEILCTQVDNVDYTYQCRQLQRKKRDLNFNE